MSAASFSLASQLLHWVVGGLLGLAVVFFLFQFIVPAIRVGRQLTSAHKAIAALKVQGPLLDLDRLTADAIKSPALAHCWAEYRDTLHGQKQADELGNLQVVRWRATTLAPGFFTESSLIDGPLRAEFYKHLPGMLTGLGIIGTFGGLILGLQDFKVTDTDNATQVRQSLSTLIQSVGGAFLISGSAILLAMLVTLIEKAQMNRLRTRLERLCGLIDSLFDAGAGEEYLQRLVDAAETSATQALQMKESLVTDLKQVLTELTQQQIATMTSTSHQLGQSITASLSEGLKEPLQRISNAVETVGGNQGEAINRMLTDVLSSFAAQMESMFGGQLRGMNDMLQQTSQTIATTATRFDALTDRIERAGSGAADAMARRMEELMTQMRDRQAQAEAQMAAFVDGIQQSITKGQSESAELALQMMRELTSATDELVKGLRQQSQAAQQDHVARQADLAKRTDELLTGHGEQVRELADAVGIATASMRETVDKLQSATQVHLDKMNLGADKLNTASGRLRDGLDAMGALTEALAGSADKLLASTGTVNTALAATERVLADQRAVRDALANLVSDLRATVDNAKREAGFTKELLDGLQVATQRLVDAQRAADTYLEGVTEVLGEAHAEFANQVQNTLRSGNATFHQELSQAVNYLKGAIQDLGDVLDALPAAK